MCIIAVKQKNIELPKKEHLENCFSNNQDGAGFMYTENKKVYISKGYMDFKTFYEAFLVKVKKETPAVLHFRTATHGSVSKQNCHPFPVSTNVRKLKATHVKTDIGVAHNGIIPIQIEGDLSDSMQFVKDYLSNKDIRPLLRNTKVLKLIERAVSSSKLAFMYADGEIINTGTPWQTEDNILYSNSDYKHSSKWSKYDTSQWDWGHYSYGKYNKKDNNNNVMSFSKEAPKAKYCKNCFTEIPYHDVWGDSFWCDVCGTTPLCDLKTVEELAKEATIELCSICEEPIIEGAKFYVKNKVYCDTCYKLFGKEEEDIGEDEIENNGYLEYLEKNSKFRVYATCEICQHLTLQDVDINNIHTCLECGFKKS